MRADIEGFCQGGHQCTVAKVPARKDSALGYPLPVPNQPGDTMSLDFVGPLRATRRGNSYILVMIDHLTRDVELKATRHPDAESAVGSGAQLGVPERRVMISDRGTHFTNKIMTGLCKMLRIEQRMTTPYHGKTERYNHTLVEMLRIYANEDKDDWDELLPMLAFAHRTAIRRRCVARPWRGWRGPRARGKLTRRVREAWKLAQRTTELTKQTWDSSRKPHIEALEKYHVGDLVYVLRNGGNKDRELGKLADKWKGPYRITDTPVKGAARLESLEGEVSHKLVNLGQLCKHLGNTAPILGGGRRGKGTAGTL
ncbi:gag-pol fusion protein [Pelomyxa schiedti]|nr:gag-pol fusion protein [Pelomyxa schiedti]